MLLAGSTAAEAPHRASRGHAPVSLVGTSQRDSNALRTQRSAAPSRARAVGGPGADLLRGKRGAPTKSVDLRNWLGCNGRSVFFWTFLGTPDRRTTLALAQSQPVMVNVSRSPPSWPNQLVPAPLKCSPGATLGGSRREREVRALWLLKSTEPLSRCPLYFYKARLRRAALAGRILA